MNVRHAEFMAMTGACLGSDYDRTKLAQVEQLQCTLHHTQSLLVRKLQAKQISPEKYVAEVNKVHRSIALQCEAILGPSDFFRLFGLTPAEISQHIDMKTFLELV